MSNAVSGDTYKLDYESWEAFKEAVGLDSLATGDKFTIEVKPDSEYRAEFINIVDGRVQVRIFGSRGLKHQALIEPTTMTITVG